MSRIPTEQTAVHTRHRAVGYMVAANQIEYSHTIDYGHVVIEPKYFLYSHSIELALKAYLMVNGHSAEECRFQFSHDLEKALDCAVTHGLSVSEKNRGIIASLSRQHNRPFSFKYFNEAGWSAPSFENISECCRWLISEIQGPVFAANRLILRDDNLALRC